MEIIYTTTHLVMAICTITVFYFSLKPDAAIPDRENLPLTNRFNIPGLKWIQIVATTGYKIAMSLLITYIR